MANSRVDHARQKKEKKEDTRYNYATQRRGREIKTGEEGGASIHDICIKILLPISIQLQGRAKERELSLLREVLSGPIGCALAAQVLWVEESWEFKHGTILLQEPVFISLGDKDY